MLHRNLIVFLYLPFLELATGATALFERYTGIKARTIKRVIMNKPLDIRQPASKQPSHSLLDRHFFCYAVTVIGFEHSPPSHLCPARIMAPRRILNPGHYCDCNCATIKKSTEMSRSEGE